MPGLEVVCLHCVRPQVSTKYGLPPGKMLRSNLRRELTLVRRNAFIYVFRTCQVRSIALSWFQSLLFDSPASP